MASVCVLLAGFFASGCGGQGGLPESVARQADEATAGPMQGGQGRGQGGGLDLGWLQRSEPIVRPISDWTLQETAEDALGRMGEAAVPMLVEKLRYENPDLKRQATVRRQAAEVLARIGPRAESAVPALIKALDDSATGVRKSAALALGQIGPAAADAAPALLRTMLEVEPTTGERRP